MTRPLFEVGEVVILQSQECPEKNGEYPIRARDIAIGTYCGARYNGYVYELDGINRRVAQPSLRKKHQPGEKSFRDMMQSLTQGQPA